MSSRKTSPTIANMAARILAAGNPLDNDQVILAVIEGIAEANSGRGAQAALKTMFQPYFENMLSLAGSCLSQAEPDDDEDGQPRIVITATVGWDKITNAIVGSFEGGSTDWLREYSYVVQPVGKVAPPTTRGPAYAEDQFWATGGEVELTFDNPEDDAPMTQTIGLLEIKAGLRKMAEKSPRHFANLLSENDDAITHDVFMQHVIFGEVIYG